MKHSTKYLILLICIASAWGLSGCKKQTHSKLIGSWEMVKFDAEEFPAVLGKPKNITYTFTDGDMMIRDFHFTKAAGGDSLIQDTGYYYVQISKFKTYIKIVKLDGYDYNGLWWIDKLDAKMLAIQRTQTLETKGGAYLRSEFLKK